MVRGPLECEMDEGEGRMNLSGFADTGIGDGDDLRFRFLGVEDSST